MLEYSIYFIDGNVRLLCGQNLIDVLEYLKNENVDLTTIKSIYLLGVN